MRYAFLLVENDQNIRELIAAVLRNFGWHVYEASTGEQAKAILERDAASIAAILCGQTLGSHRQDGMKLFREIDGVLAPLRIPFVLMVSDPNPAVARCAQETQMIVVSRPFRIRVLLVFLNTNYGVRIPVRVASEL